MKCPHCHHKSDKSQKLKCSQCGQQYERGHFEEFQNLEFLENWIQAREDRLGDQAEALLAEIETRQGEVRELLGIYLRPAEEVARELALTQGAISRVTSWCKAVPSRSETAEGLTDYLQQRTHHLEAEMGARSYELDDTPKLVILDFALKSAPGWRSAGYLSISDATSLIGYLQRERGAHVALLSKNLAMQRAVLQLIPDWVTNGVVSFTFAQDIKNYLSMQVKTIASELGTHPAQTTPPLDVIQFSIQELPGWAKNPDINCNSEEIRDLGNHLLAQRAAIERSIAVELAAKTKKPEPKPTPVVAPKMTTAAAAPAAKPAPKPIRVKTPAKPAVKPVQVKTPAKPKPIHPPKPKKPPIDWGKVWEKIVQAAISGAFLRGLLYLGAFMIVVSLAILVVRFWDIFPSIVQVTFIFSVPTTFYIAGWLVGGKLKLPQAGGVLTGIGALLVAVDFAAIYQFGGLSLNLSIYWLVTSLICAIAYTLTAWRMQGVFFDYIALIGGGSTILALTFTFELPLAWSIASMTAYGFLMVIATTRLWPAGQKWREPARATRSLSQLVIPVSLILVVFVPGGTTSAAISTAFLLSTLGYGILARSFQAEIFVYLAVGSSIGAIGFAFWSAGLPWEWFATTAAALATPYILIPGRFGTLISNDNKTWRSKNLPFYIAGIGLLITALLVGLGTIYFDFWAGVFALTLISLVMTSWAYFFRQPVLIALGSGFFLVPYSLTVSRLLLDAQIEGWVAWLMAAWAGLALVFMGTAVILKWLEKYVVWFLLWAQILIPTSLFGLYVDHVLTPSTTSNVPTLAALGGIILFYAVSAVIHDSGRYLILSRYVERFVPGQVEQSIFFWLLAILSPIWIALLWDELPLQNAWLGVALAILSLVYVGIGQLSQLRKAAYRLPWHTCAYILGVSGLVVAFNEKTALLSALYIDIALLIAFAVSRRRFWEVAIAALLFIWPFQLTLELSLLTPHAYSLAYALLASCAYIPIGIMLNRYGRKLSLPLHIVGFGMSVLALGASLLSIFDIYPVEVPWIGLLVSLIISGLYIFSTYHFRRRVFAWASALTTALAFWQALILLQIPGEYHGIAWVGLAVAYMLFERLLTRITFDWIQSLRPPLGVGAVILCAFGLGFTAIPTMEGLAGAGISNDFPVIFAQAMAVGLIFLAAWLYRSRWPLYLEPVLAFFPVTLFFIGYAETIFGQALTITQFGVVWSALAIGHLVLALLIDTTRERYAHGLYLGGYVLALLAVVWTLADAAILLWTLGALVLISIGSALLIHFNRHHTWDDFIGTIFGDQTSTLRSALRAAFLWVAAWLSPIWFVLLLNSINVLPGYQWIGFSLSALAFIGLAIWSRRFDRTYAWAFQSAAQVYSALALAISALPTIRFLLGDLPISNANMTITAAIAIQTTAVVFYALWAGVYRQRYFAHLSAWLSFFPYTLLWIGYSSLTSVQFALPWVGWSALLLIIGFSLDRLPVRYARGPYLAGYLLTILALVWSIPDRLTNLYALGATVLVALVSHLVVHFGRHHTWDDFIGTIFGDQTSTLRSALRAAFLWVAAWLSPIWIVLLLNSINVLPGYQWIGFSLSALAFIGLAVWTRRYDRTYAWAFQSAAQVYSALALAISALPTIRFLLGDLPISNASMTITAAIAMQTTAVVFYALWAGVYRQRFFAHLSAWLSFSPYTLLWIGYSSLTSVQFSLPWAGWGAILLLVGFALDRLPVRYAHGPYLAGYLLTILALVWSIPDRLTNLYALGAMILIALISHLVVHFGRHHTFDDFIRLLWRKPGTLPWRVARISFLFCAVYAVPVWLTLLLTYHQVPWAWRGLALALVAPLYIAFGLAIRRVKNEYTWPFYSAGYALTAIAALVAIEDLSLAIYVLSLNTVVYAISAYIFRQPAWLYLSNTLLPVILLLTLYYNNRLTASWISPAFMILAFLYLAAGLWLDGRFKWAIREKGVSSFGLPFYSLCYLLSAIALAVASSERSLAIAIFTTGVVLYALSAWIFREALFLYPAAWLAAVPYYLGMTLLIPETRWYGLGWLPLILVYISFGRFAFRDRLKLRPIIAALAHPAVPFYLLAYALSISMVVLSAGDWLTLTLALAAGTGIYMFSAALFRRSIWLYPGLFTAHCALLAYFNIQPSGTPAYYISLPFMGVTWLMASFGYLISRRSPTSQQIDKGHYLIKLGNKEIDFGDIPSIGYLRSRSWAQPLLLFAVLDLVIWQSVALLGFDTAIIVSLSFAILLGLFAMLWFDRWLSYGSLALTMLAIGVRLAWTALSFAEATALVGGIGLGMYLIGMLIEQIVNITRSHDPPLAVWLSPLRNVPVLLTTLAVAGTLPFLVSDTTACAAALAFAGALYLAIASRGRRYRLGYLGTGMLLAAWVMVLAIQDINQPQLYAIPFGVYLAGIGYFEIHLGRVRFGNLAQCFGFSVMLITSFIQSLNGMAGFPYFLLLMAESLAIFGWGAAQHCKIPLFIGIGGSVINVLAQIVILVNVYQVSRWFVTLGVGLVLVVIGVIVERKRERIITRTKEWREALQTWT